MSNMKNVSKKVNAFEKNTLGMGYFKRKSANKAIKKFGREVAVNTASNVATDLIENGAYLAGQGIGRGTKFVVDATVKGVKKLTAKTQEAASEAKEKVGKKFIKKADLKDMAAEAVELVQDLVEDSEEEAEA